MGKVDLYLQIIEEVVSELKIPLIKEKILDKIKINKARSLNLMKFKFREDISVIKGFFGLADYFHSVVIQDGEKYYIPVDNSLYILEND